MIRQEIVFILNVTNHFLDDVLQRDHPFHHLRVISNDRDMSVFAEQAFHRFCNRQVFFQAGDLSQNSSQRRYVGAELQNRHDIFESHVADDRLRISGAFRNRESSMHIQMCRHKAVHETGISIQHTNVLSREDNFLQWSTGQPGRSQKRQQKMVRQNVENLPLRTLVLFSKGGISFEGLDTLIAVLNHEFCLATKTALKALSAASSSTISGLMRR